MSPGSTRSVSVKHWKDAEGTIAPITPKGVVGREEVADEKASVIGYSRVADKGWVDEELVISAINHVRWLDE